MNRSRTIWSVLCLVAWLGLCSAQLPNVTVDFSCKSGYEWMLNGKGENPCRVYAYLSAQSHCFSDDTWTVEPLDSGHKRYPPPSGDDATPCQCNEPVYSLIQACTVCQGFPSTTGWSDWTDECEDTYQGFPYGLTPDIDIPAWANLDVIQADKWSEAVAKTYAASADSQNQPTSTPDPQNSQTEHNKAIKIIIGSCVGVGCLLIIVGVIIWYSLRKKHRRSPTGGVESPSDSGTLKRPTSGVPGGSQVGSNISTLPMVQTMGQYPPTYGGKQRGERPTSGVTGDPQVGAAQPTVQAKGQTAPTWGPTRRRDQDPRPRRRDEDDSPPGGRDSPDPSSTDETPHLKPPVYLAQRLPSSGTRVDEDEDEDEPVYRPSSAYQTSNQAMMNWRSGTAGGPSSSSQQPVSAQWGNGPAGGGGYMRPGASKLLAAFGADPATRWSPFRRSPATGADSDPAGPLPPPPPPAKNPKGRGWTGPSARFSVNDARREESDGNPDAPADSPLPALAVASSSGSQQPTSALQNAKVPPQRKGRR